MLVRRRLRTAATLSPAWRKEMAWVTARKTIKKKAVQWQSRASFVRPQ